MKIDVGKLFERLKVLDPEWFFYVLTVFSVLPIYLLFMGFNSIVWVAFVLYFIILMYYHNYLRKCFKYSLLYGLFISWFGFQWALGHKMSTFLIICAVIISFFLILTTVFNLIFRLLFYLRGLKKLGFKKYVLEFLMVVLIPSIWFVLVRFIAWKNIDGDFLFKYGLFVNNTGWVSQIFGLEGISILVILFGSLLALHLLNSVYHKKYFEWFGLKKMFKLSKHFNKIVLVTMVLIFILVNSNSVVQLFDNHEGKTEIKVGLIQPNFNQSFSWRKGHTESELLPKNFELTKKAVKDGAQIVVWPESSVPFDILNHRKDFLKKIRYFAKENSINLAIGSMTDVEETSHTIVYVNSEGEVVGNYVSSWLSFFSTKIVPGHKIELFNLEMGGKNVSVGSILCYEEFYNKISSQMRSSGAELLVVTSNNQHVPKGLDLAGFFSVHRAAETNLPLIRSTNTGVSQIISSKGKVLGQLPQNNEGYLVRKVWI